MATRPVCEQCIFFQPPATRKDDGQCNFLPPEVAEVAPEDFKTVPRPSVEPDSVACSEFKGLH